MAGHQLLDCGWRLYFASRNFAEGVRARSSEYAQFDVTRTSSTAAPAQPAPRHAQAAKTKLAESFRDWT